MPLLDLAKVIVGLSRTWAGYLRDWDRSLDFAVQLERRLNAGA
jgi:hypothetical protein